MVKLIAIINRRRVLGKDNDLVWDLPNELARFREKTSGQPVIMGSATWRSLPKKPLPGRMNVVLSRDPDFPADGAHVTNDIAHALGLAREASKADVWVIGGAQVFALALPYADRLYLTIVEDDSDDASWAHFPPFEDFSEVLPNDDPSEDGVYVETDRKTGKQMRYQYVTLARPASSV